MNHDRNTQHPERLYTIDAAAKIFGLHRWKLRRAIKSGLVPSYAPFNSRRLVYLSEVQAVIGASKHGGEQ